MRALVLDAPADIASRPLKERELPLPEPGPGELRLKVLACGVCRTDLHEAEGDLALPKLPIVLGHQIVGVVEAAGPGAGRFEIGERVGVPWVHATCGACEFCRRGDENLCEAARFTGYHVDGGYAENALAREDFCFPLPESVRPADAAPLLCAGVIGFRALRVAGLRERETVALYGFGASAHIALQVARSWGCRVWVVTRKPWHRELALKLGADWTGGYSDAPPGLADRAVSFAPAGSVVPQALARLKRGGTLALAGVHLDELPRMEYSLLYGERSLRSVTAATRSDARELLALAESIPIRVELAVFRLSQANDALGLLKAGRIDGAGVLLP